MIWISAEQHKKIKAVGSRPGVLYGLCKVYKNIVDRCPPFWPILSAIETLSYKIAKFLVPKMNSITSNEFTIKDTVCFAKEIVEQDSYLVMGSLDVDLLFTNIPLDEAIDICTNTVYSEQDVIQGINKEEFQNLLSLATKESYFIFNKVLYKQKDGAAMDSPLGHTLANVFICFYENKNGLKNALLNLNQSFIEDILTIFLFYSNQLIIWKKNCNYFNTCHPNMSFSFDEEKNGKMSFLDVEISWEKGKFVTTVYHKPTFSGVYTHFESFLPSIHNFG